MAEKITIKQWAQDDRPREKFLDKGAHSLSNAELMAILIGSGSVNESAVELSKRILESVDNQLMLLGRESVSNLCSQFTGVGPAKAVTILAAIELGRRRAEEELLQDVVDHPQKVFVTMKPYLEDLPHEEFWVLYFGASNNLLKKELIAKGGITETTVDKRLILKQGLLLSAVGMILCHNHPSGNLTPSRMDIELTRSIVTASSAVGMTVFDHIIFSHKGYCSFMEKGLL